MNAPDTAMNAPRRVALLARRAAVLVKHLVDEVRRFTQFGFARSGWCCTGVLCPGHRPPDNPPMDAELRRHTGDRADSKFTAARTIRLWLCSPQKAPRSDRADRRFKDRGWAKIDQHSRANVR